MWAMFYKFVSKSKSTMVSTIISFIVNSNGLVLLGLFFVSQIILVSIKTWGKLVELPKVICNLGQNVVDKSTKLSKIGFPRNILQLISLQFCSATVKSCLSKYFRDSPEISKILTLNWFSESKGNSYIHFLLIKI